MSYELHITRAEHWAASKDTPIGDDEWLDLVESDDELRLDPRNGPYCAVWSGPSRYAEPWFDWFEGDIHSNFPDPPMLGKMLQIAARLGARVQGDDGEIYTSIDDHPGLPPMTVVDPVWQDRVPAYLRRERLWNLLSYGLIAAIVMAAIYFDWW